MEKDKRTNQNRKFWIKKKHQLLTPIKAKGGKQKKNFWTRFDLIRRRDMYHLLFFFRNGRAKPFHLHSADVIWWGSFVHFLPIGSPRRPISLSKKRRDMAKKEEKTTHTRPSLSFSLLLKSRNGLIIFQSWIRSKCIEVRERERKRRRRRRRRWILFYSFWH